MIKKAELSLLITDNRRIRRLNKKWRNKDRHTDVLSFPQWTRKELIRLGRRAQVSGSDDWVLGDIVISLEFAQEQAILRKISLQQEVERLFIHGVVHLLGYDHEVSAIEARRMRRVERYLLTH